VTSVRGVDGMEGRAVLMVMRKASR
jgi:hypothetical protein